MNVDRPAWPVDAHVHFHEARRVAPSLDAAATNFKTAGNRSNGLLGVLLLAQSKTEQVFESLRDSPVAGDWRIDPAGDESETLIARRGPVSVAIVCGRQLRTKERLEVLALGTCAGFPDDLPLGETIGIVQRAGALAVLPWGFGKWSGQRGRLIESAFACGSPDSLFAGDNGGRVRGLPSPRLIQTARARGFRVLPGSDPFPFGGDHRRVGAFGFVADATLKESAPWRVLRLWLLERRGSPTPYGRACNAIRFAFNQIGIQVRHRLRLAA